MHTYDAAVAWLYGLRGMGVKLGLHTIRAFLGLLGRPQDAFPTVLIAGTNGKGSTAAMLEAMLREHGRRPGLFTSPHLVRPNERIRIAGEDIGDDDFRRRLAYLRDVIRQELASGRLPHHPSFFEVMTAAALVSFRDAGCDVAVLEVGMGGRLDATNAAHPVLSVVVTLDLDHVRTLGGRLEAITLEKSAVARPATPLLFGPREPALHSLAAAYCRGMGAQFVPAAGEIAPAGDPDDPAFDLRTRRGHYRSLRPSLAGAHQRHNAGVAVEALELLAPRLGFPVDPDAVRRALAGTRWPGRLHWLPGRPPLLLDGAHNPAGVEALEAHLRDLGGGWTWLFSALRGKDAEGMLARLARWTERLVVTQPAVDRVESAAVLAELARKFVPEVHVVPDPEEGLRRARRLAGPAGRVLVAGSLYLVGEVLALETGVRGPGLVAL